MSAEINREFAWTKCIATYASREETIEAMIELDEYRSKNRIPITVRLLDEICQPSKHNVSPNRSNAFNQPASSISSKSAPRRICRGNTPDSSSFRYNANLELPPARRFLSSTPQCAPQPIVYVEYFTPLGTPYYYNTVTQLTQWEFPPSNSVIVKANFEPKKLPEHSSPSKPAKKPVAMPKFTAVTREFIGRKVARQEQTCSFTTCLGNGQKRTFSCTSRPLGTW